MRIYSVYDNKSKTFGTPFFQTADVQALRAFKMEVNRPHDQNVIYHNPEDFSLHLLGELNTETGVIGTDAKTELCTAESLVEKHDAPAPAKKRK